MKRGAVVIVHIIGFVSVCLLPGIAAAEEIDALLDSYGNLTTVSGTGMYRNGNYWNASMEGGPAVDAELSRPHMTMADVYGNLFIADKEAHAIRKITPDGTIHTVAGTGIAGYNDDGPGVESQLDQPNGLYTLHDGTTYILDMGNDLIRRLDVAGNLTTVIDDPNGIFVGRGLWVSPDESLIYYASGGVVKKWTADEGLSTYAGGFLALGNMDVDPTDGNLVVTDRSGHGVYKLFDDGTRQLIAGNETTYGGGDGQSAIGTGLDEVRGISFTADGGYFLATHHGGQVWYVDTDDIIHLVIDGDNNHTYAGDGLPLTSPGRKISEPRSITLAPNGDLLITESDYGHIRVVDHIVPEPSTLVLGLIGLLSLLVLARRRR